MSQRTRTHRGVRCGFTYGVRYRAILQHDGPESMVLYNSANFHYVAFVHVSYSSDIVRIRKFTFGFANQPAASKIYIKYTSENWVLSDARNRLSRRMARGKISSVFLTRWTGEIALSVIDELTLPAFQVGHIQPGLTPRA
jgi:hypothetical protein